MKKLSLILSCALLFGGISFATTHVKQGKQAPVAKPAAKPAVKPATKPADKPAAKPVVRRRKKAAPAMKAAK